MLGRLRREREFAEVFKFGRLASTAHFELFAGLEAGSNSVAARPRLGLACSRKAAPTAVLRNLAKRIIRARARAAAFTLPPRDFVVRGKLSLGRDWMAAKQAKQSAGFRAQLKVEVDQLFARASRKP